MEQEGSVSGFFVYVRVCARDLSDLRLVAVIIRRVDRAVTQSKHVYAHIYTSKRTLSFSISLRLSLSLSLSIYLCMCVCACACHRSAETVAVCVYCAVCVCVYVFPLSFSVWVCFVFHRSAAVVAL